MFKEKLKQKMLSSGKLDVDFEIIKDNDALKLRGGACAVLGSCGEYTGSCPVLTSCGVYKDKEVIIVS